MRYYLIDYENVHAEGMHGSRLANMEAAQIKIFYSGNISPPDGTFEFIKLKRSGKNALDFQIVSHLATLIVKDPIAEYFIISKDQGYLSAIDELMAIHRDLRISLNPSIYQAFSNAERDLFHYMWPEESQEKPAITLLKKVDKKEEPKPKAKTKARAKQETSPQKADAKYDDLLKTINCSNDKKQIVRECLMSAKSKSALHDALNMMMKADGVSIYRQIRNAVNL